MTPIRFYFDFVSTFSYIAIQKIDALAAQYGRQVDWRAVSLGHVFQAQEISPPFLNPAKFKYLSVDFARSCELAGLPCKLPAEFPPGVKIARLAFWYLKARDENLSHAYARAIAMAIFGRGELVGTHDQIMAALKDVPQISAADIEAAATDAQARTAMTASLDDARADGMIGAPFMVLDGEPFWGADRLDQLAARLKAR
jgi:2-hydroxychromene-2-carboxylate isomerase